MSMDTDRELLIEVIGSATWGWGLCKDKSGVWIGRCNDTGFRNVTYWRFVIIQLRWPPVMRGTFITTDE